LTELKFVEKESFDTIFFKKAIVQLANFKTHMVVGATVSGVSSTLLLSAGNITDSDALLLFTLGTIGSLLPDIDSKTSIPFKVTFTLLSVFLSFIMIFSKANYSLIEQLILWLASFYFMKLIVMKLFIELTSHRGIFHSIPMGFLLGILGTMLLKTLFWIDSSIAVWSGFFITLGFLTHLILDEVYSVDLANKRMKKSFGTAFTFYKKNNVFGTFVLYFLIIALFQNIANYTIVTDTIFSQTFYINLWDNIFPQDRWFYGLFNI